MYTALIVGCSGQDGSFLAEFLLARGYDVHGTVRRSSSLNWTRIEHLSAPDRYDMLLPNADSRFHLHYADLADSVSLERVLDLVQPDLVFNLGAQSHVRVSFDQPLYTVDVVGLGTLQLLEAVRRLNRTKDVRFYQASSSEMFGSIPPAEQRLGNFHPRSPYGCAKLYAHYQTINYREAYNLHASCGVLYNHESPRRGESFVTRKITLAAGRIKAGLQKRLVLGNLDSRRDWGYAGDYIKAMLLMLQQDTPDDYIIATGRSYTIRNFLEAAFNYLDLDYEDYVVFDPKYCRPSEVDNLLGDPSKARAVLGWEPEVDFNELVRIMVEHDLDLALREKHALCYNTYK